jgi:hypothetical protein
LITEYEIDAFQVETDKILREYCLINIENTQNRIATLKSQIKKMSKEDMGRQVSMELLERSKNELKVYIDELQYLNNVKK